MLRSLILSIVLVALATIFCVAQRPGGQQTSPPPLIDMERTTELRVNVVGENGRSLPVRVMVQLRSVYGSTIAQKMTDTRGEARFSNLRLGEYQVVVTDASIEPRSVGFVVQGGEAMHMEDVRVKLRNPQGSASPEKVSAAQLKVPKDARKEFEKGTELWRKDKLEEARAHFLKAVEIYPEYAAAHNNLGASYMRSNEPAKAREAFERAVAADPQNGNAAINLARIVYGEQNWARADQLLTRGIADHPNDAQSLAMLAVADFNLKKYDEAVAYAGRAHALEHKQYAVVHLVAARALTAQNKTKEARAEYETYLKEAPQSDLASTAQKELEQLQRR